jgi:hypothetical protein
MSGAGDYYREVSGRHGYRKEVFDRWRFSDRSTPHLSPGAQPDPWQISETRIAS